MILPLQPDTAGAQKYLEDWAAKIQAGPGVVIPVSTTKAVPALKGVDDEVRKIGTTAGSTSKSVEGIFQIEKMHQYAKAVSAARGAFDNINEQLGLIDKNTVKVIDQGVGLAEEGVHMGAAFGPRLTYKELTA